MEEKLEINKLRDVYDNIEVLSTLHGVSKNPLIVELEEPEFTIFINQIKASKVINIPTEYVNSLVTNYKCKKQGTVYEIFIKVVLIGEPMDIYSYNKIRGRKVKQ